MSDDWRYALTCWTCGRTFRINRDGWLVATPPQPVMVLRAPGLNRVKMLEMYETGGDQANTIVTQPHFSQLNLPKLAWER